MGRLRAGAMNCGMPMELARNRGQMPQAMNALVAVRRNDVQSDDPRHPMQGANHSFSHNARDELAGVAVVPPGTGIIACQPR